MLSRQALLRMQDMCSNIAATSMCSILVLLKVVVLSYYQEKCGNTSGCLKAAPSTWPKDQNASGGARKVSSFHFCV